MAPSIRASQISQIHNGIMCNSCKMLPIVGVRYFCPKLKIDLCERCEDDHPHNLVKIKRPVNPEEIKNKAPINRLPVKPTEPLSPPKIEQAPISPISA
jgi:hypothetical protein